MNTTDRMEDLPEDAPLDEEEESGAELLFPGQGPSDQPGGGAVEGWPNKRRCIPCQSFSLSPARGVSQPKAEPALRIPQRPDYMVPERGAIQDKRLEERRHPGNERR